MACSQVYSAHSRDLLLLICHQDSSMLVQTAALPGAAVLKEAVPRLLPSAEAVLSAAVVLWSSSSNIAVAAF